MSVTLILGPVEFTTYAVPERINGGGEQMLSLKKLVGGARDIQVMGPDDDDINWSGLLFGSEALQKMQLLDFLRYQGLQLPLIYSQLSYIVVIKRFTFSLEREYQIRYNITVTILKNLTLPAIVSNLVGYSNAILTYMSTATAIGLGIANGEVSASLAVLSGALNAIPSLDTATNSQLTAIISPLSNALSSVSTAISHASSEIFG